MAGRLSAARVHAALRALPIRGFADAFGDGPILVLAPHPDDETLGCGGLIAEAASIGHLVHILVLTDGTGSHPASRGYPAPKLRRLREAESRDAARALGLPPDRVGFLGLPDTRLPRTGEAARTAVSAIVRHAGMCGSRTLLTTWRHDPHHDHVSASILGSHAAQQLGVRLYEYPVWGWTLPPRRLLDGPLPTGLRLDVTAHLAAKRRAIACHRSQLGQIITDDPTGFVMQPSFVKLFCGCTETLIECVVPR